MKDVIIIPTYNERENIGNIIGRVSELYPDKEIWVVDDNSPDGTAAIVSALGRENPKIKLFSRTGKSGLGDAYKHILSKIKADRGDVRFVVTMDADGSHDPKDVGRLLGALDRHDLAVGSRYVRGGKIVGWDYKRLFLSFFGNIYSGLITGIPIRDSTAGFVAFRSEVLEDVDFSKIGSAGYSYQIEFKGAVVRSGRKFCEVPIIFTERELGRSKMSGNIIVEGLIMPWRILAKNRKMLWMRCGQIAAAIIFLFAIFFATFHLKESPSVWYDEGIYIQGAVNALQYGKIGIQLSPAEITHISRISVSYPLIYPLAGWFKIFGASVISARSFMALVLFLFLAASFLFARKVFGPLLAVGTLLLLATFPPLYGNGKSVLGEVPGLFYLVFSLLCLRLSFNFLDKKRKMWLLLAGIFIGFSVATKPIFIILLPAVFVGLIVQWFYGKIRLKEYLFIFLGFILPALVWFFIQFGPNDTFSSILSFYTNPYGVENLWQVIRQNITVFFTSATPLYLAVMMAVWLAALTIRFKRKTQIPVEEIIAFTFSALIIAAFLRIVGWYRYIFPAQIVALIYFIPSLETVALWLKEKFTLFRRFSLVHFIVIPVALLAISGIYGLVANSWVAEFYDSRKTAFWEGYFKEISADQVLFFYDTPEVAIFSPHRNYYQFIAPAGGAFSEKELGVIESGSADKIFIRTDTLSGNKSRFEKNYLAADEAYKYTILERKKIR